MRQAPSAWRVNDIISDVKFQTFGCGSAIASSSMATELIKGKPLSQALELTNKAVAEALDGLPAHKLHCSVLAEEAIKAAIEDYQKKKEAGNKVVMIGDGINDSPALSASDVGIAISDGAEIAREIANITISEENLYQLVTLKAISNGLMKRIHGNYRFVIGFNLGLILLGVAGVIAPATSALLHNTSTLGISLKSMTNLLNEQEKRKEYEEAEA